VGDAWGDALGDALVIVVCTHISVDILAPISISPLDLVRPPFWDSR